MDGSQCSIWTIMGDMEFPTYKVHFTKDERWETNFGKDRTGSKVSETRVLLHGSSVPKILIILSPWYRIFSVEYCSEILVACLKYRKEFYCLLFICICVYIYIYIYIYIYKNIKLYSRVTQLSIPTHAQLQRHRLKFIKNDIKNSYMFRSTTMFRELQCPH